jgi:uncharacterized protein YcfJ
MNKQLVLGVGIGIAVAGVIGAVASFRSGGADSASTPTEQAVSEETRTVSPAETFASTGSPAVEGAAASGAADAGVSAAAKPAAERYAVVLASTPVTASDKIAREECQDVQVERQKPIKDEDKIAGTAIGAVVGGVIGNQIGDGDGRKIATVAGAVGGAIAGRKIQERVQNNAKETVTEKQCKTVHDTVERTDGYKVKYELDGTVKTIRMKTDPGVGTRIPANDARLSSS